MQATVKQPATEARQTRHGMRIFVTLEDDAGREIRVEGDPGDTSLKALRRGQRVEVFKDLRGEVVIGKDMAPAKSATATNAEPLTFRRPPRQVRDSILEAVTWQARLYLDCRDEVARILKQDDSAVATAIFQNALREFRLP